MTVTVVTPDAIDFGAYASLQRASFASLLTRSGVADDFMSPDYYQWKYQPPAGPARVAIALEHGEMVGSLGMFPLRIAARGRELIGWQFCDGATAPQKRGLGYFAECVRALHAQLGPDELSFGFPNANSRRSFGEIGWRETQTVTTFAGVIPLTPRLRGDEDLVEFDLANDMPNARTAAENSRPGLVRDAAYLRWRYGRHPLRPYSVYVRRTGGGADGYIVLREASIAGRRAVLVMELHASSPAVETALLAKAADWGVQHGIRYIVMVSNCLSGWTALKRGFVLLPSRLLPKRQTLMGAGTTPDADAVMNEDWLVQMGDWDAF